jgi:hypothetical protein
MRQFCIHQSMLNRWEMRILSKSGQKLFIVNDIILDSDQCETFQK